MSIYILQFDFSDTININIRGVLFWCLLFCYPKVLVCFVLFFLEQVLVIKGCYSSLKQQRIISEATSLKSKCWRVILLRLWLLPASRDPLFLVFPSLPLVIFPVRFLVCSCTVVLNKGLFIGSEQHALRVDCDLRHMHKCLLQHSHQEDILQHSHQEDILRRPEEFHDALSPVLPVCESGTNPLIYWS